MSTTIAHPGITPGAGRSSRFLGIAAAGLAVVITIGFVFAASQGTDVAPGRPRPTVSNMQPAHPMVSDAHRVKAEILAERRAAQEAADARYEYLKNLNERADAPQAKKAMWEQRYDDLVERFQNQYDAGRVIDDTLIGYK